MITIPARKIKICFVAPKAYPIFNPRVGDYFGGAEVDLYYLAVEIARDGRFQVIFLVADYGQPSQEIIENVKVVKTIDFQKNPLHGLNRVWQGLKSANADIYIIKTISPGVPLTAWFCRKYRRVFVYRTASRLECDGTYLHRRRLLGRAFYWSLRRAGLVITQNRLDKQALQNTLNIPSIYLPNGHPLPVDKSVRKNSILWVGRSDMIKRPRRFLELAQLFPQEKFIMICQKLPGAEDYAGLRDDARQLHNLTFIGHVPFNEIDAYFAAAKVLVNTSDSEGFPNTFIQAGKHSAAILSLNVDPDGFLAEYRCGFSSNGSMACMAEKLRYMLADERYLELGGNARKYVEQKHDIAKIITCYKEHFLRLMRPD